MSEFTENLQRCPQLIIYLGLALLSVGTSFFFTNAYFVEDSNGGLSLSSNLFMHLFQILIISGIFYFLCKYNYQTASWVLLLFPVIIMFLLLFMFFGFLGAGSAVKTVISEEEKKKEAEKEKEKEKEEEKETFKGFDGKYETILTKV